MHSSSTRRFAIPAYTLQIKTITAVVLAYYVLVIIDVCLFAVWCSLVTNNRRLTDSLLFLPPRVYYVLP